MTRCRRPRAGLVLAALLVAALALGEAAAADDLAKRAASLHRTPANVARDPARQGLEVLRFFGLQETGLVVEILPGSAGYSKFAKRAGRGRRAPRARARSHPLRSRRRARA